MTDVKYSIDQINSEIGKLLAESNLEELTPKIVRRKLEERLKYEEFSLDEEEPKTLIKGILDEFIARVQQEQERQEEENGNNEASGSEGEFESDEGSTKAPKKSKKRKLTSEGSENEDNSESDDDSKSEKSQRSKSNSTASKSSKDPSAKMSLKIKNLKNYVLKCGVRKVWSKELRGMSDRQQVKHLQNLLIQLGVEGRPTLEKCKKVSILRELEGADVPTESESENGDDDNEGDDSMGDSDSDTKSKSSKKGGKKIIESDEEEENDKNGKVDENSEDNDSEIAVKSAKSGTDNEEDTSNTKPKSKPVIKKPKVELTPTQEKISKLKSFVFKCGVRKMWSKELADLDEREQIAKLNSMLRELGVEGQPTNDKCTRVKEMRELEAEKNSVDVSNIIESDSDDNSAPRTRSSRSATQSKVKTIEKEVEKLEEIKPQKRNDFFSFLNDSDIDD